MQQIKLKITRKLWVIVLFFSFDRILDQFLLSFALLLTQIWINFASVVPQCWLKFDSISPVFASFFVWSQFCLSFDPESKLFWLSVDSTLTQFWHKRKGNWRE